MGVPPNHPLIHRIFHYKTIQLLGTTMTMESPIFDDWPGLWPVATGEVQSHGLQNGAVLSVFDQHPTDTWMDGWVDLPSGYD